jgi:beta-glucanase (GH16 family)
MKHRLTLNSIRNRISKTVFPARVAGGWVAFMVLLFAGEMRAQNILSDTNFATGNLTSLTNWITFGTNNYVESGSPALSGNYYYRVYGNLDGVTNFTGIYQEIPAAPGNTYTASGWAYSLSSDAIHGDDSIWIEVTFQNSNYTALADYRSAVVTSNNLASFGGSNTWFDLQITNKCSVTNASALILSPGTVTNTVISLVAPAGTALVRYQIVYSQGADNANGEMYFDDLTLNQTGGTALVPQWNVVWADNFPGTTINPTNWTYDLGNNDGWGNGELEYYTSNSDNAYVSNGYLHIVVLEQATNGYSFTSARMKTQGLYVTPTYGRWQWRAALTTGYTWPALWTLGEDYATVGWPECGEIDVMENNGTTPDKVQGSLHDGTSSDETNWTAIYDLPGGESTTNFHIYELDWNPYSMQWSVDGVVYETVNSGIGSFDAPGLPFNQPFSFIMNVAVGGDYLGSPSTNAVKNSTTFPQTMLVNYVHILEETNVPSLVIGVEPANQEVCAGSEVTWTVSATDTNGESLTYQWQLDGTNLVNGLGNFSGCTIATLTNSAVGTNNAATAMNGYACIIAANNALSVTSTVVSLTVDQPSVGGTATATSPEICNDGVSSTTISLSGQTGAIIGWQYSTNGGSSWIVIASTANPLSTGPLTVTTEFEALVQSGVCSTATSSPATVTVDQPSVGGTATATSPEVANGASTTISLSGQTGEIVGWQYSTNSGSSWVFIASTTNPLNTGPLTVTTEFEALLQSGVCSTTTSGAATVMVEPALTTDTTNVILETDFSASAPDSGFGNFYYGYGYVYALTSAGSVPGVSYTEALSDGNGPGDDYCNEVQPNYTALATSPIWTNNAAITYAAAGAGNGTYFTNAITAITPTANVGQLILNAQVSVQGLANNLTNADVTISKCQFIDATGTNVLFDFTGDAGYIGTNYVQISVPLSSLAYAADATYPVTAFTNPAVVGSISNFIVEFEVEGLPVGTLNGNPPLTPPFGFTDNGELLVGNIELVQVTNTTTTVPTPTVSQVIWQADWTNYFPNDGIYDYAFSSAGTPGITSLTTNYQSGIFETNSIELAVNLLPLATNPPTSYSGFGVGAEENPLPYGLSNTNLASYQFSCSARVGGLTNGVTNCAAVVDLLFLAPTNGISESVVLDLAPTVTLTTNWQTFTFTGSVGSIGVNNGGSLAQFDRYISEVNAMQLQVTAEAPAGGNIATTFGDNNTNATLGIDDVQVSQSVTGISPISIAGTNNQIEVFWGPDPATGGYEELESSTNVAGPYVVVPGKTSGTNSPYIIPAGSPQQFFRTVWVP